MEVKRFYCSASHGYPSMKPNDLGDYVLFDDHQAIQAQRDELLAALKIIKETAWNPEIVYSTAKAAIAKCES